MLRGRGSVVGESVRTLVGEILPQQTGSQIKESPRVNARGVSKMSRNGVHQRIIMPLSWLSNRLGDFLL